MTPLSPPVLPPKLLMEVLATFIRADQPLAIHGPSGVGKSEIVREVARRLGWPVCTLDLTVMEPSDLLGLPMIEDGVVHYTSPGNLPAPSVPTGLLFLDEINRCELHLRQPLLRLVQDRELGAYQLPAGWRIVAALNDSSDGYQVDELDPALAARFGHVSLRPDRDAWLSWVRGQGVHPAVRLWVAEQKDPFGVLGASPRTLTNAGRLLMKLPEGASEDLVRACLDAWVPRLSEPLLAARVRIAAPIRVDGLVGSYNEYRLLVVAMGSQFSLQKRLVADVVRWAATWPPGTALPDVVSANLLLLERDIHPSLRSKIAAVRSRLGRPPAPGVGS